MVLELQRGLFHVPRVARQPVVIMAFHPYCVKQFGKRITTITG